MSKRATRKAAAAEAPPQQFATIEELVPTTRRAPDVSLARPMWVYIHHPRAWEVKGDRLLPDLSQMPLLEGVNGTDYNEALKRYDLRGLRANLSRAGKYQIPLDVDAGAGIPSYVVRPWPGFHVDRWTTLYEGSAQQTRDDAAYDDWRASLVQRGIVKAPTYGALREMQGKRERQLPKLEALLSTYARVRPDLEAQIARIRAELTVIEAALADIDKPEPGMASALASEPVSLEAL